MENPFDPPLPPATILQNLSDINVRTANSLDRLQRGLVQAKIIPNL